MMLSDDAFRMPWAYLNQRIFTSRIKEIYKMFMSMFRKHNYRSYDDESGLHQLESWSGGMTYLRQTVR